MAQWSGWWEQSGLGRQRMRNLVLEFDDAGAIHGSGDDCIGPFTFHGQCRTDGTVSLVKQYLGRHRVFYEGCNSGEGIFGTWQIPCDWPALGLLSGKFALRPMASGISECKAIRELAPVGRG
jgi:hypothetical protein